MLYCIFNIVKACLISCFFIAKYAYDPHEKIHAPIKVTFISLQTQKSFDI
jgi:hypothetical protein